MKKVVTIYGGNSKNSRLYGLYKRIDQFLADKHYEHHSIFVCDLPADALINGNFEDNEILKVNKKVEEAEVIIIITPVYKSSFSGILKTYLDMLPEKVFECKTILPFAMGGTNNHILMLDYALKPVLTYLGSRIILKGGFIHNSQVEKIKEDEYFIRNEAEERILGELGRLEEYFYHGLKV